MGQGTATGGVCYSNQLEAAQMWCSSVNAPTAVGQMTCKSLVTNLSSTEGGPASFTWTRQTVDGAGNKSQGNVTGQLLPGCETYGIDYWHPYIVAFVGAAIALLAWQLLYRSLDREGS